MKGKLSLHLIQSLTSLLTLWLSLIFSWAEAQTARETEITIIAQEVYARDDHDNWPTGSNEYTWKIWVEGKLKAGCIQGNGGPGWYNANAVLLDLYETTDINLQMKLEAWENDCKSRCSYNTDCTVNDDDGHCGPQNQTLNLYNYRPGGAHTRSIYYCSGKYGVKYLFTYKPPIPRKPSVSSSHAGHICHLTPAITLTTATYIKPTFHSGVSLQWQYKAGNGPWRNLGTSKANIKNGEYSFTNIRNLTGIRDITRTTSVVFQVRSTSSGVAGKYSAPSDAVSISPAPPVINTISTTPSCPNFNTGTVAVNVTGTGDYRYILREGFNGSPCDPDLAPDEPGSCFTGAYYGRVIPGQGTRNFLLPNIDSNVYTLLLTNIGGRAGVCYGTRYPIRINELAPLSMDTVTRDVSCPGGSDGELTVTGNGGKAPYLFTLQNSDILLNSETGRFTGLSPGSYVASVTDVCDLLASGTIAINQPKEITATVTALPSSCNSFEGGRINVVINQGEGEYYYRLLQGNILIDEHYNSTDTIWSVSGLSPGNYEVIIENSLRPQCGAFVREITLEDPPAMSIGLENINITPVTCPNGEDGEIELTGMDMSGIYKYILTNAHTSTSTVQTTASQFSGLSAGTYLIAMERNVEGCTDRFELTDTIKVLQPDLPLLNITKKDISCSGELDGSIRAEVSGNTSFDQFVWELLIDEDWNTLSFTTSEISDLPNGTYRLRLKNSTACEHISDSIYIREPSELILSGFSVNQAVCFGSRGSIDVNADGGTLPYSYEFLNENDSIVRSANQRTELVAGSYSLTLMDSNQCMIGPFEVPDLSEPAAALDFSYTLSDYSGLNISCYNGNNGHITIEAKGGNGSGFSGYSYAINEGFYQPLNFIDSISGGTHSISVIDDRGCIVSKNILFTQSDESVSYTVVEIEDEFCAGDANGVIHIEGIGGEAPYTFNLNGNATQNEGKYVGLTTGEYTISITDTNGCKALLDTVITSQIPPIILSSQVKHVSCFGKQDGSIVLDALGGTGALNYSWDDVILTVPERNGLAPGGYLATVNDEENCKQVDTIIINEPQELTASLSVLPACVGSTTGKISVLSSGGIAPYTYSLNGEDPSNQYLFEEVAVGEHTILVKDFNACEYLTEARVEQRIDRPEPNFLVATKENAGDTLIIKDISVPKPDSIQWLIDSSIVLLRNDMWEPEIMVPDSGSFNITLIGYFSGCIYETSVSLSIAPYDPGKLPYQYSGSAIEEIVAAPNPSNGVFNLKIKMGRKQRLFLTVFDLMGTVYYEKSWDGSMEINEEIELSGAKPGIYELRIITESEIRDVKLVVN